MLYILHMGNHPDLKFRKGSALSWHLQADLMAVVRWAEGNGVRWAFSDCNAGAYYANFYRRLEEMDEVNWVAVQSTDFRDMVIKEGKQAEISVWEVVSMGTGGANRCHRHRNR